MLKKAVCTDQDDGNMTRQYDDQNDNQEKSFKQESPQVPWRPVILVYTTICPKPERVLYWFGSNEWKHTYKVHVQEPFHVKPHSWFCSNYRSSTWHTHTHTQIGPTLVDESTKWFIMMCHAFYIRVHPWLLGASAWFFKCYLHAFLPACLPPCNPWSGESKHTETTLSSQMSAKGLVKWPIELFRPLLLCHGPRPINCSMGPMGPWSRWGPWDPCGPKRMAGGGERAAGGRPKPICIGQWCAMCFKKTTHSTCHSSYNYHELPRESYCAPEFRNQIYIYIYIYIRLASQ